MFSVKYIDVVIMMYNLIEYSNSYSKAPRSLWQLYRDEPALNDAGIVTNFLGNIASFEFKQKITNEAENNSSKNTKMMVPFKYLSNFGELSKSH